MTAARPRAAAACLSFLLLSTCHTPLRSVPQGEGLTEAHVHAYRAAAIALDGGDPAAALRFIEPYAGTEPWHVPTHLLRQDALLDDGREQEARAWYAARRSGAPDDSVRVLLATRVADREERRDGYEQALQLDPASAWARIALTYELLRDRDDLERESRARVDAGDPEDAASYREASVRALARAEQLADEAADLTPDLAAAHLARVEVLLVQCALSPPSDVPACAAAAVAVAERAVELAPLDPAVLERLARTLHLAEKDDEAAETLAAAIELAPRDFVLHANLGRVLLDLRDDADALKVLEHAHRMRPDDVDVLLNLGVARFRARDLEGARAAFLEAGRLAPEDARPIERLVPVDYELSRNASATVE